MDDFVNYCFHLSMSQRMSDLRIIRGSYDTLSIFRGVAPSIRPSVATQIIWMPLDGVLLFEFQINVSRGYC